MPVQEIFVLPWLLWSALYKIFFFVAVHYFKSFVPIAKQAGRQSCWVAWHLVFVCLWEVVCRTGSICTCEHFSYLGHFHSLCAVKKAEWGAKHHFALQLMVVRYKELHLLFYSILAHLHNSPPPHCQKNNGSITNLPHCEKTVTNFENNS